MSDQSVGPDTRRPTRDGVAWNVISWVAAIAGTLSVAMTLTQGVIVLAGHTLANTPKGTFWAVLMTVTSPGVLIAALGLLCGVIGWFSAYRRRALIGIVGFVVTFVLFVILTVAFG